MSIAQKRAIKAIRLDTRATQDVREKLASLQRAVTSERRIAPRIASCMKACILHMPRPDVGDVPAYLVPTRDISNFGITFLHGTFIYPGSKGILQLIANHGVWKNVVIRVIHSTYIAHGIHNTGARFQSPIEVRDFSAQSGVTRIMIVEDNPLIAALTEQHLSELDAEIHVAKTGEAAIESAKSQIFDAILMDMQLPGIDGFETTRKLREQGFVGTIVAATGLTDAGIKGKCIAAGCNSYLPKPLGKEQLAALLASLRSAPILSTLRRDALMKPLISEFITELPQRVWEIESAYANDDMSGLQNICRALKGEAGAFGFEQITEAAGAVEKDIIDGKDKGAIKLGFENIIRLCCQVRSAGDD